MKVPVRPTPALENQPQANKLVATSNSKTFLVRKQDSEEKQYFG